MVPNVHQRVIPQQWIDRDRYVPRLVESISRNLVSLMFPRYNVAPRTHGLVLRRAESADLNQDSEPHPPDSIVVQSMKWGLVPWWAKFEDKTLSTTNARSENLVDGAPGMWNSLKGRRCAVLCQGYVCKIFVSITQTTNTFFL